MPQAEGNAHARYPERLCADVERVYRRLGRCQVAVCEGQHDEAGGWFGAELNNLPGQRGVLPANMGQLLARLVWSATGLRARAEKPGLAGRSCAFAALYQISFNYPAAPGTRGAWNAIGGV